jgi:hypothetical protein
MQELNASDSLWHVTQPPAVGHPLELATQPGPDTTQDDPDGPESPICCWNICTGIRARTDSARNRRKPTSD